MNEEIEIEIENDRKKEIFKDPIRHVSFICGILSILTCSVWYIGIITGIIAIVLGARSIRHKSKLGLSGMILGIIGAVFSLVVFVFAVIIMLTDNSVIIY